MKIYNLGEKKLHSKGSYSNLFDQNDVSKDLKVQPNENDIEYQNIGTEDSPKIVKLSWNLHVVGKEKYINLMKNYTNVFSWSYEDLKEYDTSIIQQTIPIIHGEKPFRHNLTILNPMLLSLIEKEVGKLFNANIIVTLRFS